MTWSRMAVQFAGALLRACRMSPGPSEKPPEPIFGSGEGKRPIFLLKEGDDRNRLSMQKGRKNSKNQLYQYHPQTVGSACIYICLL